MESQIKVKNLSVTYFKGKSNEVKAVKNISLDIASGEFIIFFGPSGCGKSTLLYSITGLEQNIEGDIFIENINLRGMSDESFDKYRQTKIGMIFQAYHLIPSLSVLQNVTLPQVAVNVSKKERKNKALKLLNNFNIAEQANKFPQELSGGQQQRIAISRALINNPDIIFADEPVGNLDSKSAEDFFRILTDLNLKNKKTVILVTHDPTYLNLADKIFYMKDGECVDMKINKDKRRVVTLKKEIFDRPSILESKDYKMLERSFMTLRQFKNKEELDSYKLNNIVSEMLNDLSYDEVEGIKTRVESILLPREGDKVENKEKFKEIFKYLDNSNTKGGLDMDSRTAKNMVRKVYRIIELVKIFSADDNLVGSVKIIKDYFINEYKIKIKENKILGVIDRAIEARLKNEMDMLNFMKILDKSINDGGVGLDIRLAYKIAKRMELFMLCKYNLEPIQKNNFV